MKWKGNFSSVVDEVFVDRFDHVEVHFGSWEFVGVFGLFLFVFPVIFLPAFARSIPLLRLRMVGSHSYDERIFLLGVLFGIVEHAMNMIFPVDFLFYFRVVLLSLGLF